MPDMLFDDGVLYDAGDFANYSSQFVTDGVFEGSEPSVSEEIVGNQLIITPFKAILQGYVMDFGYSHIGLPEGYEDSKYRGCLVYVDIENADYDVKWITYLNVFTSKKELRARMTKDINEMKGKQIPLYMVFVKGEACDISYEPVWPLAKRRYETKADASFSISDQLNIENNKMLYDAKNKIDEALYNNYPHVLIKKDFPISCILSEGKIYARVHEPAGYTPFSTGLIFHCGLLNGTFSTEGKVQDKKNSKEGSTTQFVLIDDPTQNEIDNVESISTVVYFYKMEE